MDVVTFLEHHDAETVLLAVLVAFSCLLCIYTMGALNLAFIKSLLIPRSMFDIGTGFMPIWFYNFFNFVLLASIFLHFYFFERQIGHGVFKLKVMVITSVMFNHAVLYILSNNWKDIRRM